MYRVVFYDAGEGKLKNFSHMVKESAKRLLMINDITNLDHVVITEMLNNQPDKAINVKSFLTGI